MSLSLSVRRLVLSLGWGLCLALPAAVSAQTNYYARNGTEYPIVGSLPGDQVCPDAALTPNGGFVVWQDNATDGSGWGISAEQVNSTLSGSLSSFRVNVQGTNDQENPRVAMLRNGGAAFVWQGGKSGFQHIYGRFLNASNTFLTSTDLVISTFTNGFQGDPALAALNNSNVVVVWSSFDQAASNSLLDVYGQLLSPAGQKIGTNFLINQFTTYNQRHPTVAALATGGFVVAWVSEQERSTAPNWGSNTLSYGAGSLPLPSVDIYARLYSSNGVAQGNEFLVNADSNPASSPAVAAAADGSFMVTWCAKDLVNTTNSWDIYARSFTNTAGGAVVRVNTTLYGDQYLPRISAIGGDYMIVWTSLGQDGSREGVFGQFVHEDGTLVGGEFQVNTTWLGQQIQPVVASDGADQFLVVWTSFTFTSSGMDLFAQRYLNVAAILPPIDELYVWAPFCLSNGVYQPQLQLSWAPLLGISVSNYEIYLDGATTPTFLTTSNPWTMTAANGLTAGSTNSFTVDYVTTAGHRSPPSPSVSGTTWSGLSYYGIPYEWMAEFFGGYYGGTYHTNSWPSLNLPPPNSPPGAPTIMQLFVTGGIPYDPSTWLVSTLTQTGQGMFLSWNTQPGFTYQVQVTANFNSWSNVGAPRFAYGSTDGLNVGNGSAGYYRIVLVR